ncbi:MULTISPECIES: hypothetical protein [unclassified Lentimonas]|uniref:hypothetical protein n=1 Tax=unclassified Lentimonas TaxID=2630993 RepID=UPI0013218D0D|nr:MULTISPECIES: hypothetical protein [unclassified Lentimonas]CAA6678547.1 Unannotated [Lentimonas sp. CC4]CAA6685779.1 Unannotated [Lentimonas sp. CC6]CAA6695047.1 Unannotated [Lentimonas sp. CC19]CAA6697173.1 Unannotated [Lentimonas sp. CC10]CAA7069832.1 Unannotated [Lentimonas sp. CC11]
MEYTFQIIPEHELVIEIITGEVTVEELAHKTQTVFSDPLYLPTYNGVIDMRCAISRMSKVELYGFASLISQTEMFEKSKWAIVAEDPIVVALSHIFQQRIPDQTTLGIFCTIKAAAEFVGRPQLHDYLQDE